MVADTLQLPFSISPESDSHTARPRNGLAAKETREQTGDTSKQGSPSAIGTGGIPLGDETIEDGLGHLHEVTAEKTLMLGPGGELV